jgi:hypothetical protein
MHRIQRYTQWTYLPILFLIEVISNLSVYFISLSCWKYSFLYVWEISVPTVILTKKVLGINNWVGLGKVLLVLASTVNRVYGWTYFCSSSEGLITYTQVKVAYCLFTTHSWSWALLEKLPIVQLLKNFTAFCGTRRFITVFTRALHWYV